MPSVIVRTATIHRAVVTGCGRPATPETSGSPQPIVVSRRIRASMPAVLGTKPRNAVTGEAAEARVELLCQALSSWGRGHFERRSDGILCEVPQDAILELVEVQSGFAGVVTGIRVEEPTLDRVYDKLLGAA